MLGHDSLATTGSSLSSSEEDGDEEGQEEQEDEFRDDEADPFEAAAAAAKEKERLAAEKREADKLARRKARKSAKKTASEPPATSTPAPKKRRTEEDGSTPGNKSVVVEKVVTGKKKKEKKNPANSAASSAQETEAPEAGTGRSDDSDDSSDDSSSSGDDEDKQEEPPSRESSKKKKKKKSHKKSDSDSDDAARKLIAGLAKSLSKKKKKKKNKKRARSSSESSSSDSDGTEEAPVLTEKTWKLKDNGVDTLDMELRHLLRPPTTNPDTWWKPPFKSRVSRPIRGASLNMESVLGHARVHDSTIRRCHDRTALINTKMLLARNADISIKDAKLVKIGADKLSFDRKWGGPEAVSEIAEAVANFSAVVHYVRGYSYEGLAISRALHDAGWLLGVVSSEREQLELLEGTLDLLLSRNSQRARTNLPPLTHEQVRATIRTYLHRKGKSEAGLYGVDPYSGRKRLSERDQLKQDVEASIMSKMNGRGGGGARDRDRNKRKKEKDDKRSGKQDGASKVARLCRDYNSQEGCQAEGDCPKGVHRCAKRKGDFVCQQNHPKTKCDHPKFAKR